MSTRSSQLVSIILCGAVIAGCSSGSNQNQGAAASAKPGQPISATADAPGVDKAAADKVAIEAKATRDLQLYEQMRIRESYDLAAQLGADIASKYPGTDAAGKVNATLADVRAKATAQAEVQRLARMWAYSAAPEKGGMQYAASIESTPPLTPTSLTGRDAKRVHLIVRQHPAWGQNVYLMLDNEKFDCRDGCPTLAVAFDNEIAKPMRATIPPTGEPALFIEDDRTFINRMLHTKRVTIDVALKGDGKKKLVFETGGLDMSHLPGATKKK
jgi:hypothetical protein